MTVSRRAAANIIMKKDSGKARAWASILYQESAVPGWKEIIAEWHVPALISPVHDKDEKKPHWHALLVFPAPVSHEYAKDLFAEIGGVGCEKVKSVRGYARYLCHLDEHGKKFLYDVKDVVEIGEIDYSTFTNAPETADDMKKRRLETMKEIMKFCVDNCFDSYAKLALYAASEKPEWFELVVSPANSAVFYRFLRSIEYDMKRGK